LPDWRQKKFMGPQQPSQKEKVHRKKSLAKGKGAVSPLVAMEGVVMVKAVAVVAAMVVMEGALILLATCSQGQ
jgi:hypothetical protein